MSIQFLSANLSFFACQWDIPNSHQPLNSHSSILFLVVLLQILGSPLGPNGDNQTTPWFELVMQCLWNNSSCCTDMYSIVRSLFRVSLSSVASDQQHTLTFEQIWVVFLYVFNGKFREFFDVFNTDCTPQFANHVRHTGREVAAPRANIEASGALDQLILHELQRVCVHVWSADCRPVADRLRRIHVGIVLGVVLAIHGLHCLLDSLCLDDAMIFKLVYEIIV